MPGNVAMFENLPSAVGKTEELNESLNLKISTINQL